MNKVTKQQASELRRLAEIPDDQIDTTEMPVIQDFHGSEVGRFYRPIKKQVTLRLDADLLAWFKDQGNKYQTRINAALREFMETHKTT